MEWMREWGETKWSFCEQEALSLSRGKLVDKGPVYRQMVDL
jgi:hypothetical protein